MGAGVACAVGVHGAGEGGESRRVCALDLSAEGVEFGWEDARRQGWQRP